MEADDQNGIDDRSDEERKALVIVPVSSAAQGRPSAPRRAEHDDEALSDEGEGEEEESLHEDEEADPSSGTLLGSEATATGDEEEEDAPPPLRRGHVAPAVIALDRIDEDGTFQMRPEGDLSRLATDLARLGQLFPIDLRLKPPDRFQVVAGFRRVAALRFLQRDKVFARLHTDLSDEDALLMALAATIHATPVSAEDLGALSARLAEEGRLTPAARDMLDKARAEDDALAAESSEEEVDADELAAEVTERLGEINQDLSLLADAFASLDETKKSELLRQLRYSSDLVAFLEGK